MPLKNAKNFVELSRCCCCCCFPCCSCSAACRCCRYCFRQSPKASATSNNRLKSFSIVYSDLTNSQRKQATLRFPLLLCSLPLTLPLALLPFLWTIAQLASGRSWQLGSRPGLSLIKKRDVSVTFCGCHKQRNRGAGRAGGGRERGR